MFGTTVVVCLVDIRLLVVCLVSLVVGRGLVVVKRVYSVYLLPSDDLVIYKACNEACKVPTTLCLVHKLTSTPELPLQAVVEL